MNSFVDLLIFIMHIPFTLAGDLNVKFLELLTH